MKKLFSIILLIGLAGNIVSSSLPDVFNEMSEWKMEQESEKDGKEIEKIDADLDEVWTNEGYHFYAKMKDSSRQQANSRDWNDIHGKLISPPPDA